MKLRIISAILLCCLSSIPQVQAEATLFLAEPYGFDGAFVGTGHAAVYLSRICATSPVILRLCEPGETGIVLSRYRGVSGYDWIAIPLIPYLYAVESREDIPLFADKKLLAFLRDRYRRNHLETLVPDLPDGGTPGGNWYELIGASYIRTIYAFEIETSLEQDARLIRQFNAQPNRQRWNLVTANCADFARQVISFYYPHSVHRSIIGDLGVTTPKQLARTLSEYASRHPELKTSIAVIGQVPGTIKRSRQVHGVLESVLTAKKYILPLFLWHPYIVGGLIAVHFSHGQFHPSQNALTLNSGHDVSASLTPTDRRAFQKRLEEVVGTAPSADSTADERYWASLHAAAKPFLDASGGATLQVRVGGKITPVGITRANILSVAEAAGFAAGLVKARLRVELKPAAARKTARADVEVDLALLQQLLALQARGLAITAGPGAESRTGPAAAGSPADPAESAGKVREPRVPGD